MGQLIARQRPIGLIPWFADRKAETFAFQPGPNLVVPRGTVMGQVSAGVNDVWTVTLANSPTGGTFTVTITNDEGSYTTAPLAYNVSTANMTAAINGLANVPAGSIVTTGTAGASYVLTDSGTAGQPLGVVTASGALLTGAGAQPTATPVHTTTNATAGEIKPYIDANGDGTGIAIGFNEYDFSTDDEGNITLGIGTQTGIALGHESSVSVWVSGSFREEDLIGIDTDAITDLKARTFALNDGTLLVRVP